MEQQKDCIFLGCYIKRTLIILLTLISNIGYSQNLRKIERHLLNLINEERNNRGLSTFVTDTLINNGAKIHANYLSKVRRDDDWIIGNENVSAVSTNHTDNSIDEISDLILYSSSQNYL